MENKKRSLRLALFLALSAFITIVFIASRDHKFQGGDMSAKLSFGLDLELKWIATDANADFALVQDTLRFYADAMYEKAGLHSSRFKLDHCCDDAAMQAALTGGADFYHLGLTADFTSEASRNAMLAYLHDQGLLQVHGANTNLGSLNGNADFTLPLPNQPGKTLQIHGSQFQLNFVPRTIAETPTDPMA
jgi:hypothetical protein